MSVDLSKAIVFKLVAAFESMATFPGERGISIYRPERFVLDHKHQVSALSLDALLIVAMLVQVVAAAPSSDGSPAGLDLMMVSAAALS